MQVVLVLSKCKNEDISVLDHGILKCQPKVSSGLGLKLFRHINMSLLAKLTWKKLQ